MSVTLNAAMAAGNNGTSHDVGNSLSFSTTGITVAAGSNTVLVVTIGWMNSSGLVAPATRSVTWNGVSMTERAFLTAGANNTSSGIYVLINPTAGAQTLAGSWVGLLDAYVSALCFNGADQTTGIATGDTVTGTATTISVAGSADGATLATIIRDGTTTASVPSRTIFWNFDGFAPGGTGAYDIGTSGSVAFDFSGGSDGGSRALAAVHVIAASGGGPTAVGKLKTAGPGTGPDKRSAFVRGIIPGPQISIPTTVSQVIGAWSWAGTTSTTQPFSATYGALLGVGPGLKAPFNIGQFRADPRGFTPQTATVIQETVGAYSWAGTTSQTTQLINAGVGTWSWAGTTATTSQLIFQSVGAWTWAGTTATLNQEIDLLPGSWTWAGTTSNLGGVTTISAIVGAYTWAGATATTIQLMNGSVGAYTWSGTTSSTIQLINQGVGAYTWSGSTSTLNQLISGLLGVWVWTGTTSSVNGSTTVGGNRIYGGVWSPMGTNTIIGRSL